MPPVGELGRDKFFARNNGERVPMRGGSRSSASDAGVFALNLVNTRTGLGGDFIGFRAAYASL